MTEGVASQIFAETLQQNPSAARASQVFGEVLALRANTPSNVIVFQGFVREILAKNTVGVKFDGIMREVLVSTPPTSGPIPVFPILPMGFPASVKPTMKTTVGQTKSLREMRAPQQPYSLWEMEILFEELRDQTQNQRAFAELAGYTEYMQLVENWLMMYGKFNVFAFDASWDDSRANQQIGTGDGVSYIFTAVRTWGQGTASLTEPVGMINEVTQIKVGGIVVPPSNYYVSRNKVYFIDGDGIIHPPGNGLAITMTFSFYYVCRFTADNQSFEEFMKNRYSVKSLKFRSIYWP